MKNALSIIALSALLSCANDDAFNLTTSADLNGKWIEARTKGDTLTFESWDSMEIMTLDRGKEMRGGYLLPEYGSGPYQYKLSNGKISLYWMLSSNYAFKDFKFKQTGNMLTIANFYNSSSGSTLTFVRLN